jgi:aminoglycoside 2'-N-acetyltransferase I
VDNLGACQGALADREGDNRGRPTTHAMPTLSMFRSRELPPLAKAQILAFMRIEWTAGYSGEQQFRDEVWPEGEADNTVHFVLEERGLVISQAGVVWKTVVHDGVAYATGGLTGVLTFPDFARKGFGTQVVEAATRHIAEAGADIGLSTCQPRLRSFYERAGWTPLPDATVVFGDARSPTAPNELVLMLFVSDKGRNGRQSFEAQQIYVGPRSW